MASKTHEVEKEQIEKELKKLDKEIKSLSGGRDVKSIAMWLRIIDRGKLFSNIEYYSENIFHQKYLRQIH